MLILNCFLFICFINFCNSYTLINKKYSPYFLSRHKLNMGCDYYIDKDLEIYDYNDKIFSSINLEHERGYYWFSEAVDEDEDGYDTEYAEYIERKLQPSMKPIVIYSDKSFNKLSFENKYRKLIEDELKTFNKTLHDVQKIIKIEHRYER